MWITESQDCSWLLLKSSEEDNGTFTGKINLPLRILFGIRFRIYTDTCVDKIQNICRLENEHLNNAGKFRAVKTVPLPFREVDEED